MRPVCCSDVKLVDLREAYTCWEWYRATEQGSVAAPQSAIIAPWSCERCPTTTADPFPPQRRHRKWSVQYRGGICWVLTVEE